MFSISALYHCEQEGSISQKLWMQFLKLLTFAISMSNKVIVCIYYQKKKKEKEKKDEKTCLGGKLTKSDPEGD